MWKQVFFSTVKSLIPFKNFLRQQLRVMRPYESLHANDSYAFEQGLEMVVALKNAGACFGTVLEIGTGWVPTIPYIFHSVGAKKLVLTDVEPLMDEATRRQARDFVESQAEDIALATGIEQSEILANLRRPLDFDYLCPFDFEQVKKQSADIICSRTVLEHISPKILADMIPQMTNALKPAGLMFHIVDNSDHFEHKDKSISRLNFLRYSKFVWLLTHINKQEYQNRLRHSDYAKLFDVDGLESVLFEGIIDEKSLIALASMNTHQDFNSYTDEDKAALTSLILIKKQCS